MLTSLKIVVEGQGIINLSDNHGSLSNLECNETASLEEKIELPNKIILDVSTITSIKLKELWLGNIKLSNTMLDQICMFTNLKDIRKITTFWDSSGRVLIDFFSPDFIQYHLIYGNKFYSQ